MNTPTRSAVALLAAVVAAAAPASASTIDSFDGAYNSQDVYFSSGPPMTLIAEQTVAAAVPGGTRRLQLVADSAAPGYSNAGLKGDGDLWAFAGLGQRLNFNVAYGTQAPMNLDLSAAGALRLDMYFSTPMKLVVYASTQTTPGGNPNASALSIDVPALFNQNLLIPLGAFSTNSATGLPVNWADVDALAFFISASGPVQEGGDGFWARELSAVPVPEPASAALLLMGLGALALRRKA